MPTPSLPVLVPQLHAGPDTEADVLTECLALQQLHASTQLAASDGKGGRALGQELLPGMRAGRQGQADSLQTFTATSPAGGQGALWAPRGDIGMTEGDPPSHSPVTPIAQGMKPGSSQPSSAASRPRRSWRLLTHPWHAGRSFPNTLHSLFPPSPVHTSPASSPPLPFL